MSGKIIIDSSKVNSLYLALKDFNGDVKIETILSEVRNANKKLGEMMRVSLSTKIRENISVIKINGVYKLYLRDYFINIDTSVDEKTLIENIKDEIEYEELEILLCKETNEFIENDNLVEMIGSDFNRNGEVIHYFDYFIDSEIFTLERENKYE